MSEFALWPALIGGLLIGLAATLLLFGLGRIAGISGILGGVLVQHRGDVAWRAAFLGGLVLGGLFFAQFQAVTIELQSRWPVTILAGLLVGFGTRLGNGCTSGHGVCGIARLSRRSILATVIFILVAIATATLARWSGLTDA